MIKRLRKKSTWTSVIALAVLLGLFAGLFFYTREQEQMSPEEAEASVYETGVVTQILTDNREKLHELAKVLLEKETITGIEFMAILAPNQLPSSFDAEAGEAKPEEAAQQDEQNVQDEGDVQVTGDEA